MMRFHSRLKENTMTDNYDLVFDASRRTTDKMKIEIDYNGSIAVCKVDGKPFKDCSNIDRVFALDALYVVKRDYERELSAEETIKTLKKNGTK